MQAPFIRTILSLVAIALSFGCSNASLKSQKMADDSQFERNIADDYSDSRSKSPMHRQEISRMEHCDSERKRLGIKLLEEQVKPEAFKSQTFKDGRLVLTTQHKIIKGVTTQEVDWFFRHFASPTPGGLTDCKLYVLLDDDHVSIEGSNTLPSGELQTGSRIIFSEQLVGAGKKYRLVDNLKISEISSGHFTFTKDQFEGVRLGVDFATIVRTFRDVPGGVLMKTVFTAGIESMKHPEIVRGINSGLTRFAFSPDEQGAWLNHMLQEYANLEVLIPWLKSATHIELK